MIKRAIAWYKDQWPDVWIPTGAVIIAVIVITLALFGTFDDTVSVSINSGPDPTSVQQGKQIVHTALVREQRLVDNIRDAMKAECAAQGMTPEAWAEVNLHQPSGFEIMAKCVPKLVPPISQGG